ncbi:MAG: hypothetical protein JJ891_16900 [Rhizobiaceae bacterium]|nr:hypothetical protein [Rhizobiaceae bacterium]
MQEDTLPNSLVSSLKAETLSLDEVASVIGRAPETVRRNCRKWNERFGFPLPVRGTDWRFPAAALRQYLRSGGAAPEERRKPVNDNAGIGADAPADYISEARKGLHARYGSKR